MGLKLGWAPHFSSSAVTVFQIHLFLMSLMCPVPEIFFTKPIDLRFHSVAPTWKGSAPGGQRVPVGWTCTWGVLAAPSEHLLVSQGKARSLSCFYGMEGGDILSHGCLCMGLQNCNLPYLAELQFWGPSDTCVHAHPLSPVSRIKG